MKKPWNNPHIGQQTLNGFLRKHGIDPKNLSEWDRFNLNLHHRWIFGEFNYMERRIRFTKDPIKRRKLRAELRFLIRTPQYEDENEDD